MEDFTCQSYACSNFFGNKKNLKVIFLLSPGMRTRMTVLRVFEYVFRTVAGSVSLGKILVVLRP